MISIVCPIYNEEGMLIRGSYNLAKLSNHAELIFVDGGSNDRSREIAMRFGEVFVFQKGRALQMNHGAELACGGTILFLHADTRISSDALFSIQNKISNGCIGGCLTQRIDNSSFIYRLIEAQGNIRAALTKEFYGDQGIFVRRDVFFKAGGFPEVPIMEDVLFTRKLRALGETVVLPQRIVVSARRWEKKGILRTALLFNLIVILFWLKVPLHKIKRLYADLR